MRTLLLTLTTCLLVLPAQAKYSGGTGEPNDPYEIATAADLIALGETPDDYDKHFILTADIDLAGYVFDKAVIAPNTGRNWILFQGRTFTGTFDGNAHTISHLTIRGEDWLGLFGQIKGSVKNLGVVNVNVTYTRRGYKVGGLTGENYGSVIRCYSTGAVSGSTDVGGLVGENLVGNTTCSYSTARVSGGLFVGGLVGSNYADIANCYSTGAVSSNESGVGGLAGGNWGTVSNCYSTGAVSGVMDVGGLVGNRWFVENVYQSFWDIQTSGQTTSVGGTGKTTAEMKTVATFANWDFAETWTIQEGIGYPRLRWEVYGLPAMVPTTIERISGDGKCSPAGSKLATPLSVRVKNQDDEPMFDVPVDFTVTTGGGTVEPSSTLTDSAGIASTVLTLGPTPGLNQVEATADGLSVSFNITGLTPGYGGGTGEPNDPYQIWTAEQMDVIGAEPNDWGKHFKLMADIDLSDFDGKEGRCMFNVIGNQAVPFTGVFNGGAHTISHLTVEGGGYLALFGKLGSGAKVMDLGVVDANVVRQREIGSRRRRLEVDNSL